MGRDQQQSNPGRDARAQGSGQQQQNQASRQPQQDQSGSGGRQQGGMSGQQGSGASRQPQQFNSQAGQQGGGGGQSSFAQQIQPHQNVVDADGRRLGTVDHLDGDRIKLARSDSNDGKHHFIELSQVAGIEGGQVRLRERGDNDFGLEGGGTTGIS